MHESSDLYRQTQCFNRVMRALWRMAFTVVLFLYGCSYSLAQKTVSLQGDSATEISDDFCLLKRDLVAGSFHEAYLFFNEGKFCPIEEIGSDWTNDQGLYWAGVRLSNQSGKSKNFVAELGSWDSATVCLFESDSLLSVFQTGKGFPLNKRDILVANSNMINLFLEHGKDYVLILQIQDTEIQSPEDFRIKISPAAQAFQSLMDIRYFQGIFIGIILIMIFYNLFVFFSVRHRSYLYYVLMLLGSGFIWLNNYKLIYEYLLTEANQFSSHDIGLFVSSFFGIFLILFTQSFLETRTRNRRWHKVFWGFIVFLILVPLLNLVNPENYPIYRTLSFGSGLIVFLSIFFLSARLYFKKFRPARYFFYANLAYCIGTIIFLLGALEVLPLNAFVMNSMQVGNILEIGLFSFALADRINILKKENEISQQRIIDQLRENEALKDKVNRELEQKVRERTAEIFQQKEEISAQRDEIEAQRDTVILQKNHIQGMHEELTSSIRYALRIQQAVLPSEEQMKSLLGDHYVMYLPKDIVSGDFFWAIKVKQYQIFCVADCTGHGVPGGFMSMLGISFLNEIVRDEEVTNAAEVLNRLRIKIVSSLKQHSLRDASKEGPQQVLDGMDIALCVVDSSNLHLQFAAANNSLYIVRNNSLRTTEKGEIPDSASMSELIELKADKMPIAIHLRMDPFTMQEIQLEKEDCLYLMSDGMADQFGGADGKKLKYQTIKNFLLAEAGHPCAEQKIRLENFFHEWKGNLSQVDDVTVLGIRI